MLLINIGGKERPAKMKMMAVNVYRQLTGGVNIAGKDYERFTDITGDGRDKEFNPELFIFFLFAVLKNGCYPQEADFTVDDVADWVNLSDRTLAGKLTTLYMEEMTGKTSEELTKMIDGLKKNQTAPQDGATPGETSSVLPTGS